jgi:hypothetical protein
MSNREGTGFCRRCGASLPVETAHEQPTAEPHDAVAPEEAHQLVPPEVEPLNTAPVVEPQDDGRTVELHPIVLPIESKDVEPPPKLLTEVAEETSWDIGDKALPLIVPERKEEPPLPPPILPDKPLPLPPNWRMTAAIALGAALVSGLAGYKIAGSSAGRQLTEANTQIRDLNIALNIRQKNLEQQATAVASLQYELEKAQHAAPADTRPTAAQQHLAEENQILRRQIRQSDATIAQLQERIRREEAGGARPTKANARTPWGDVTWTGDPGSGGVIVSVHGGKSKPGSLQGKLPGLDCTVEPEDPKLVTVLTPPSAPQWSDMAFHVGSGGKKTVVRLRLACLAKP